MEHTAVQNYQNLQDNTHHLSEYVKKLVKEENTSRAEPSDACIEKGLEGQLPKAALIVVCVPSVVLLKLALNLIHRKGGGCATYYTIDIVCYE